MDKKTYYAVSGYEIIPCHLVSPKDRKGNLKYKADSRRDNRMFSTVFNNIEAAKQKVIEYETQIENKD